MRRIASSAPALAVIIGLALAISSASAQQVTSTGAIFGQNWNMGQDFQSMGAMGSPLARDRSARAARQASFNRNYAGAPIRPASTPRR